MKIKQNDIKKSKGSTSSSGLWIIVILIILLLLPLILKHEKGIQDVRDSIKVKSKVRVEAIVNRNNKFTESEIGFVTQDYIHYNYEDKYESEISYNEIHRKYENKDIYEMISNKNTIPSYLYTATLKDKDYIILSIKEELEDQDYEEIYNSIENEQ